MEFNTTIYEASHGKLPRGTGAWAFSIYRNPQPGLVFWARNASYGEAKKQARAYYKQFSGISTIFVQP